MSTPTADQAVAMTPLSQDRLDAIEAVLGGNVWPVELLRANSYTLLVEIARLHAELANRSAPTVPTAGPWMAVLHDCYGTLLNLDEMLEDGEEGTISIVRNSAAPTDRDGTLRMPGCFTSADQFVEIDTADLDDEDGTRETWALAQAAAAGMNAAVAV